MHLTKFLCHFTDKFFCWCVILHSKCISHYAFTWFNISIKSNWQSSRQLKALIWLNFHVEQCSFAWNQLQWMLQGQQWWNEIADELTMIITKHLCMCRCECYDYLFEIAVEMKKCGLDPAQVPKPPEGAYTQLWCQVPAEKMAALCYWSNTEKTLRDVCRKLYNNTQDYFGSYFMGFIS